MRAYRGERGERVPPSGPDRKGYLHLIPALVGGGGKKYPIQYQQGRGNTSTQSLLGWGVLPTGSPSWGVPDGGPPSGLDWCTPCQEGWGYPLPVDRQTFPSINKKACKREIHPGFETQGRRHQKSETGVSVAPKKGLVSYKNFKKKKKSINITFPRTSYAVGKNDKKNIFLLQALVCWVRKSRRILELKRINGFYKKKKKKN